MVKRPGDITTARRSYYSELASFFLRRLGHGHRTILEAGSGLGQLTFPLVDLLPRNATFIAVDLSRGPYKRSFERFLSQLRAREDGAMVLPIRSDVRKMTRVRDASVDAIVSNELLCDLRSEAQLMEALKEFYRVLRPGGVMVHGEWSSSATNQPQSIAIKADGPVGTDTPSRFWNPDELFVALEDAGFMKCQATYFETALRLKYRAAVEELGNWGVRESFLRRNDKLLRRYGIELPFEHVLKCSKP